jgi:hypothetical protein
LPILSRVPSLIEGSRTAKFSGTPLAVYVYGDSTGEQRRTSASRTDWQIVKDFFGPYPDRFHATFRITSANPPVKDRVNCVNARLRNHAGQYRVLVDPSCKALIKDFEQVCWKMDPHGNSLVDLDRSDPMRTHVSDAFGYMVAKVFPMSAQRGERCEPIIGTRSLTINCNGASLQGNGGHIMGPAIIGCGVFGFACAVVFGQAAAERDLTFEVASVMLRVAGAPVRPGGPG